MFKWLYTLRGKPTPYYADYSLAFIIWKPIRKWLNVRVIPFIPSTNLRIAAYRGLGYKIGKDSFIGMACYMDDMDPALTQIGDNVTVSYGCKFACHGKGQSHTPIVIENGAYIGMASLILSGKTGLSIGEGAIVGAGSVVTRSVPPHCVVAGNPARVIKDAKK